MAEVSGRERLLEIRAGHVARPGLWDRLCAADPGRARHPYLEAQLAMSERLSATMASALDAGELMRAVVQELHATLDLYVVVIQRLHPDEILRIMASAGPLASDEQRFLIAEQAVGRGVNGRVAASGIAALVRDTQQDPDDIVRDLETDPRSELSVPIQVGGRTWGVLNLEEVRPDAFDEGDASLIRTVATQLGVALHRIAIYGELEEALVTTLAVLAGAMEMRDSYTAEHEQAVAALAVQIAEELGLEPVHRQAVRYAA
jgi:GAF domain-containing protein